MTAAPRRRRAAAASPTLQVQLDPAISGGFILGRYDITIRGQAISSEPIEAIGLLADDGLISAIQYGADDAMPAARLPDGSKARRYAFQFNLPRLQERAAAPCSGRLLVRKADQTMHTVSFELAIEPRGIQPITLVSGPDLVDHPASGAPAILYVESAAVDQQSTLQLSGWAVAFTPIVAVQIFLGSHRIASLRVNGERDDVALVYPAYPRARISGFALNATLTGDDRAAMALRAQVICRQGFAYETVVPLQRVTEHRLPPTSLPPASVSLRSLELDHAAANSALRGLQLETGHPIKTDFDPDLSPDVHLFCDEARLQADGTLFLSGWALCATGLSRIAVFFDDVPVGDAERGFERLDVGNEFPTIPGSANAGFRFERRVVQSCEGGHTVRVVAYGTEQNEAAAVIPVVAEPPPVVEVPPEFRFELDSPALVDGVVLEPITGRLTIEGWVMARSGVAAVDIFLDNKRLGEAHYGLARQDVGAAFPDREDALRSGYAFHCPPRSLRDGPHEVRIVVRAQNGEVHEQAFHIEVNRTEERDVQASIRRSMSRAEAEAVDALLTDLGFRPHFRLLLLAAEEFPLPALAATLASLQLQSWPDWHAVVVIDSSERAAALRLALAKALGDGALLARVTVTGADADFAWDAAADVAAPLWYGVVRPGDIFGCDALGELALVRGQHPAAQLVYGDEIRYNPGNGDREPFFKPDWSPDLLLSTNYIGRCWAADAALLAATGVSLADLVRDGEYDLLLRCCERAAAIRHTAKLLYQRGSAANETPALERAALERSLARRGMAADVAPTPIVGTWRVRRQLQRPGKVSIIIPTCGAQEHIRTCLTTLRATTAYRDYETVVIDNIPDELAELKRWVHQHADRIVDLPGAFNWSRFNNRAVDAASGEYLLFLNDDIEVIQPDWLDALLEHAQRPEVAAVGPQLLYPDRKVQHAGMFLATTGIGRHAFRFNDHNEPGYFGLALTQRNVIAVTGACLLVRRDTFERLGRFDEAHEIVNNDLDFCLRAHRAGLLTVYTPYASLIHHELASRVRLPDVYDLSHFNAQWKTLYAAGDPYFSPHLSRHADDFRPDDEPTQTLFPGHPLFRVEDISRILVMKLDHIGDFITALPAIRALKRLFPQASLTVLAGSGSQEFAAAEPAIDAFLPFDFFYARSQLGLRELTAADYAALQQRLAPYRFDLAVDLRKHLSTRDVLRYSGARWLAGFDYMGQFPYLDIAVEWDGDRSMQRKRTHVVDDLLALVDAIARACSTDRMLVQPRPPRASLDELPPAVRPLFARPVVAVHAGAGNVTKQWPAEHFSALIDLLVEREGVNVVLIGGADEEALVAGVLDTVLHRDAVVSLAGQTTLPELARLLTACTLYIGNDSGPKHIAAGLGVPTIGIHSGVVDAGEWGPLGPRSLAVRRNMSCGPCYLGNAADCPRSLACLRYLEPPLVYQAARMLLARPDAVTAAAADKTAAAITVAAAPAAKPAARQPSRSPLPAQRNRGKRQQRERA